jgi:acyl transferase domain-containing protein/NAD(P)H-dependent flavin oxidoreductase YrpB (nitropropane dioxygenase family)
MPISTSQGILSRPIVGLTPFEHPDSALCIALCRAGALGLLDLGRDPRVSRNALAAVAAQVPGEFGVRIPEGLIVEPFALPESVAAVLLPGPQGLDRFAAFRPTLVQVTSQAEARAAVAGGAAGLVAKGSESGGRVGEETAFVLLQLLLQDELGLPIWVQGGIGLHSAAAVLAAGARGVLLDAQLALVRESAVPEPIKAALSSMDGSETTILAGYRVFTRPDLPAAKLAAAPGEQVLGKLGGRDLATQLVPVGQDGALAAPMARRFRTAGGVVRGLTRAIERHLRQAQELSPLAPGSPLAVEHGLRFPIVQGPMTRVSDRAAFALAVAEGGGLPFLALSLLRADEVRRLLAETQAALGTLPFGVGILGFVPEELRAEQLAVVEEFRPPVALIAGGRPDQAQSLEQKGIDTYLHVPSPALLDLFLNDGAHRFVFEGRECGGHVGPRSSFVLWEQAVERLLAHPAPEELSILFAGGIHDARSAAMVGALAAPLAARGTKIGVLMGTAYLFTEEAVSSGAITPGFQEAALRCERTALLETGPGHATRCVETDYVQDFRDARRALEAQGLPAAEVWAELEKLNLGRLRIAAKGLKREGDQLVTVDAATQRHEGMYMIGQVAAARSSVLTIEQLHEEVSIGSDRLLKQISLPDVAAGESHPVDVAIVGMACLFPGAPDLKTYWANVVGGVDSIQEVPRARWNPDVYYDPESMNGEKTPCKWGGFLADVPFDPLSFGVPPKSLSSIDPVQLLSLEVARRALADAGYMEREFDRERTSVIFGAEAGTDLSTAYGFRALYPQLLGAMPEKLAEHLPSLSEDSFAGVLSNVISGRIANRLDLGGVNYTVDAACASSLAALDLGIKELVTGSSEMVICGGADLHNSINDYLMFASVHALSRRGRCSTFDAEADGIVLGEGVACLVLKRLADAERDGDRIYSVLRGVGGSSDGRSLGLTAPRKEGQMRALERAYRQAGVSPAEVGLVEAHGTGTVVGDRTELLSLTEVYQRAGAKPGSAALGSVKSQIGHTKCAAGLAGVIKASLALYHRVLPPTLHIQKPNPSWDRTQSPFVLSGAARPWLPPESGASRKAGVSAFGFGGTNFHAVLAEYPREELPASGGGRFPAELFLFRGTTAADAAERAGELAERLGRSFVGTLADLAFTVSGEGKGAVQLALVAHDLEDLRRKLARAKTLAAGDGVFMSHAPAGQVAFLFPGQGSQRPGMLGDFFVAFPALQHLLELGREWADRILPAPGFDEAERDAQAAALTDTRVAQPSLGVVELAALELLSSLGVTPDMVGGHSYGELTALCAAGALSQKDLLEISAARAQCIVEAIGGAPDGEPGTMAAVSAPLAKVRELFQGSAVTVVNENSPSQAVIAGTRAAVEEALGVLTSHGLSAQRLQVACAFHSPLLKGADAAFAKRLAAVDIHAPTLPVFSNVTAARYPEAPAEVRSLLSRQVVSPVLFAAQVEAMYAAGARTFVEAGPGQVLTRLVGRILGERPYVAVAIGRDGKPGIPQLLEALGELAVHGVPVQTAALFAGRQVRRVDFKQSAAAPSPSLWLVNGQMARPAVGELPPGSLRVTEEPLTGLAPAAFATGDREGAVLTYLQSMQQLAEAQREVMLRYLGAGGANGAEAASVPTLERAGTHRSASHSERKVLSAKATVEIVPQSEALATNGATLDVSQLLLTLVSERTGYPAEMLNLDADLEAELSIDSIKRIEILGVLTQRLGLGKGAGTATSELPLEKLAAVKTLRGISTWIEKRMNGELAGQAGTPVAVVSVAVEPIKQNPRAVPQVTTGNGHAVAELPAALHWSRKELVEAPAPSPADLKLNGRHYWLVPDHRGVGERLAELLRARGAAVSVQHGKPPERLDGFVDATGLGPGHERLWELFARAREAIAAGATELVAASGLGGLAGEGATLSPQGELCGAGVAGLLKSLWREKTSLSVRAVDLDPADDVEKLAGALSAEVGHGGGGTDSAWQGGVRRVVEIRSAAAPRAGVILDGKSVVLLTGGGRGITAQLAVALARKFKCSFELVGRRALPAEEPPELAAAMELPSLRKALLASGGFSGIGEVEAEAQSLWAAREVRRTLAAISAAGGTANYHALDMRTAPAVAELVSGIYARHGRIDTVFHGAGVTDDHSFEDKTEEGFDRVVETKLGGALALLRGLRPDLKLLAFFGSVSGVFGNRGQVDYAAANDALDRYAWALRGKFVGPVISLDFGPWAGAGMVTAELAREYARRGVPLIGLESGIEAVIQGLFGGTADMPGEPASLPPQLVLAASSAEAMAAQGVVTDAEPKRREPEGSQAAGPHVLAS